MSAETNDSRTKERTEALEGSEERSLPFGGIDPSEAGRLSGEARRRKRDEQARKVDEARLTARQRLALALSSKLSVADYEAVISKLRDDAKGGDEKAVHALARLHDQAFGRSQPRDDETGSEEDAWESMSPAQRAAWRAKALREIEEDGKASGDPSDPRGAEEEAPPPPPQPGTPARG